MTIAELKQAELSEAEAAALLDTKQLAAEAKDKLGDLLTGHGSRSLRTRSRRKPRQTIPDYHGLEGKWASYLDVACRYERKIPAQDRDDWRHDCMLELERATVRDGKPLPDLRAYRIASLMVALYYREQNRFSTRVCVFSGSVVNLHCAGCRNKSEGNRCAWLAVRPVASLDSQVVDSEGYRVRLLDTVATDKALDLPDKWYDINQVRLGLPLRLVEIADKLDRDRPLSDKDRQYLSRWRRQAQKALF